VFVQAVAPLMLLLLLEEVMRVEQLVVPSWQREVDWLHPSKGLMPL
jgi:hypothetical protein